MSDPSTRLRGAFAPALTFFDDRLQVDHERFAEHLAWLAARGLRGVLVLGSTAETGALDQREKRRLLEQAAHRGGDLARIACLAGTVLHEVLELGALACELDYDAILVAPPFHPRTSPAAGVAAFVRTVADRIDLPVLGYCFPAQFGHGFEVLADALGTHPRFAGIKESSGALSASAFHARFPGRLFLPGGDDRILPALREGARGSITAAANVAPELAAAIHERHAAGDPRAAERAQEHLSAVRSLFAAGDPQSVAKYLLSRRCAAETAVRPPLLALDAASRRSLDRDLAALGLRYPELQELFPCDA